MSRLFPRYGGKPRLLAYVAMVLVGGGFTLVFSLAHGPGLTRMDFLIWLLLCIGAEFLWLETGSGDCTDSMASTVNFAVIFLVELPLAIWIVAVSVLVATRFIQKRDWLRSFFGLSQMALTTALAGLAFHVLHPGPVTLESIRSVWTILAMMAAGAVYFFVNTWLVSGAVHFERETPFLEGWIRNYAYRNSVLTTIALFALSPILLLSYLSVGYPGALLFFLPLLIIKNENREYIHLQKMTQALISSERMAAKGEMAAEVAHEIRNYLGVMQGRTQLLQMRASKLGNDSMQSDTEVIRQQIDRMNALARGLLDFSHKEIMVKKLDLEQQILDTVEFVRPQNLFDGIELVTDIAPGTGEVVVDGGQIQQVLINLLRNAAEAIREATPPESEGGGASGTPAGLGRSPGRIEILAHPLPKNQIRVEVKDNGPGMPHAVRAKVFEPAFTTKETGHGFGLATCYRILENHGGRIWVESEEGEGTRFILVFPRKAAPVTGHPA